MAIPAAALRSPCRDRVAVRSTSCCCCCCPPAPAGAAAPGFKTRRPSSAAVRGGGSRALPPRGRRYRAPGQPPLGPRRRSGAGAGRGGRRPRTSFRKAAVNGSKGPPGPAAHRMTRPAPGPRRHHHRPRPPGPSRRPRFGSGCLTTRKLKKRSPANPGRNAPRERTRLGLSGLTPPLYRLARYPLAQCKPEAARPGQQRISQN